MKILEVGTRVHFTYLTGKILTGTIKEVEVEYLIDADNVGEVSTQEFLPASGDARWISQSKIYECQESLWQ